MKIERSSILPWLAKGAIQDAGPVACDEKKCDEKSPECDVCILHSRFVTSLNGSSDVNE